MYSLHLQYRQTGEKETCGERAACQFSGDRGLGFLQPVLVQPLRQLFVADPGSLQLALAVVLAFAPYSRSRSVNPMSALRIINLRNMKDFC